MTLTHKVIVRIGRVGGLWRPFYSHRDSRELTIL